jgi:cytochrome c nitrite reductase small subunit
VKSRLTFALVAISFGIFAGVGITTFVYAKGASYLSNDPKACANCHVMNQQYEGWMKSGHQQVAVCNDCHVPHDFFGKWYTKTENGIHHSWAFTFGNPSVSIKAREPSLKITQDNCVRCHSTIAQHAAGKHAVISEELNCISCHRSVGHGRY